MTNQKQLNLAPKTAVPSKQFGFETLALFPDGLTMFELSRFYPDVSKDSISSWLSEFVAEQLAVVDGERVNPETSHKCCVYKAIKGCYEERVKRVRHYKSKRTPVADAELKNIVARNAYLEARWADAIQRYPDLDVDPAIAKARAFLANFYRQTGRPIEAALVETGSADNGSDMLLTLELQASKP